MLTRDNGEQAASNESRESAIQDVYPGKILYGTPGNDLIGYEERGADTMYGGAGNDTYWLWFADDEIHENAGEGIDTVWTLSNYTLAPELENMRLSVSGEQNGTGNSSDNVIYGNFAHNVIDGGPGRDTMAGGEDGDVFYVDNVADRVVEFKNGGSDIVFSLVAYSIATTYVEDLTAIGDADIALTGNGLDNILTGNGGNNRLDGLGGSDTLIGGAGNDTYYVGRDLIFEGAAIHDTVSEQPGEGTDTVYSPMTYALPDNVENLVLTATGNVRGFGNELDNILTGASGANYLDGGAGADTLLGGLGDDLYVVDAGDLVREAAGEGTDTVWAACDYSLGSQDIEKLMLYDNGAWNGTGNALNNIITGNMSDNRLDGGAGDDILTGRAGADTFVFGRQGGHDTIVDFSIRQRDIIDASAADAQATAVITQVGADVLIDLGSGTSITVQGATVAALAGHIIW